MASKVGKLIKEARQAADLTQEKLAKKVGGGLTASDISKAERGELELPLATLRKNLGTQDDAQVTNSEGAR